MNIGGFNYTKYRGTIPYQVAPRQTVQALLDSIPEWLRNEESVKARVADLQGQWDRYHESRKAYNAEQSTLATQFKADALEYVGLKGHPKADKAYAWAYDRGHSSGYAEIICKLEALADFLAD